MFAVLGKTYWRSFIARFLNLISRNLQIQRFSCFIPVLISIEVLMKSSHLLKLTPRIPEEKENGKK